MNKKRKTHSFFGSLIWEGIVPHGHVPKITMVENMSKKSV